MHRPPRRRPSSHLPNRLVSALVAACFVIAGLTACSPSPERQLANIRALQSGGRIGESIDLLREMIDAGNREGEVMYRYGRALSLMGNAGRGIWALDEALKDPVWFVRASQQQALDAYRGRNFELALEVLERLAAQRPESEEETLGERLLELRIRIETRHQFERALELAEEILDEHPDEEEAIRLKAVCLLGLKETDEAYALIHEAGILAADVGGVGIGADAEDPGTEEDARLTEEAGLASNSREAYWCMVRATFKREAGETDEAREIVEGCLERFPSDQGLLNEALKLYSQIGVYDRVGAVLKNAYEDQPDSKELRIAYVQQLDSTGRIAEAEAVLREAIEDAKARPNPPVPNSLLARRWSDLGGFLTDNERPEDGLDALGESLKELGDLAPPPLLFRYAENLILLERYDEALEIADRTPVEIHPPMIRGRVAFERGDYPEAVDQLGGAAIAWPNNAPVRYYLARAYEGVGDFDLAIEEYRQAIRSDPQLSAARERLARLHIAEGRVRHAGTILGFLSPVKRSTPSDEMHLLDIEVRTLLGQEPDLSIPQNSTMSLDALRRGAIAALARGLAGRTNPKAAELVLAELQEQISDAPSRGYFTRSRVDLLLEQGDIDRALAVARKASRQPYATSDVGLALALSLAAKGDSPDEAQNLFERVLDQQPGEVDAMTALADLAAARGDGARAIDLYERSLDESPGHWPALEARMGLLADTGQAAEARERLEAYVARHDPYDGRAALLLSREIDASDPKRRIALAERAIRFGGGDEALAWLAELDPEAAARHERVESAESQVGTPADESSAEG